MCDNQKLTWAQYKTILARAEKKWNHAHSMEERNYWFLVQCRILQAMTNPIIFFR
jgi:hypothetical protein